MSPLTLVEVLADIPDPRGFHGRIHPLPAVLGLVALGLLMGRKSLAGIARFGRQYGHPLAHALGFRRGKTPSLSTLSRTLRRLDVEFLETAFTRWIRSRLDTDPQLISLDGKTLRGSRDGDIPGQHLVAAYAPAVQAVLAQIRVDAKTNEHKAALQLLGLLPLKNKVVIGDAMFCQRDLAEQVITAGGDYVMFAKDNQPGLEIDIKAGFGFESAARSTAAAASPFGHPFASAASGPRGDHNGQSTWSNREADATNDHDLDVASEVEGFEAGLRVDA
jgi:DDE_Tnp_1-associated/Transposase DDE domain